MTKSPEVTRLRTETQEVLRRARRVLDLGCGNSCRTLEIEITESNITSLENHSVIIVHTDQRAFFPGYRTDFTLRANSFDIQTYVTSAPDGTPSGDPDAGHYIGKGLRPFLRRCRVSVGDVFVFEKIADREYNLRIRRQRG